MEENNNKNSKETTVLWSSSCPGHMFKVPPPPPPSGLSICLIELVHQPSHDGEVEEKKSSSCNTISNVKLQHWPRKEIERD